MDKSDTDAVSKLPVAALLLATVFAIVWIVLGAQGVRGTDQYNYLADTQTLISGEEPVTNLLFPAKLLREGDSPTPAWFHHNGPPILVASTIGRITGAYPGWILMNLLAHLIVAGCIFILASKLADRRIAFWTSSLYLVSPSAIWLGVNVLQEMFFAALIAMALTGFICRKQPLLLLIGSAALLAGVLCHPIFLASALALTLYVLVESGMARRYVMTGASVVYLGAVLFVKSKTGDWFPSSFQPDLAAIISSAIPGESNMFWHYSLEQRTVTLQLMLDKLAASSQRHFIRPLDAPFFVYTNLAVLAFVYLALTRLKTLWHVLFPLALLLGLYASMIVLQQNQPRYQQIVAAASFVTIAIAWSRSGYRLPNALLGLGLVASIALAGYLSTVAANEAKSEHESLASLRQQVDEAGVSAQSRIVAFDLSPHSPLAITLKPAQLLSVRTDMMDEENIARAVDLYKPTHMLSKSGVDHRDLLTLVGVKSKASNDFSKTFFGDLQLLELAPDHNAAIRQALDDAS